MVSDARDHQPQIVIVALWVIANVGVFTWKFIQFHHRASFQMLGYCVCSAKGGAEMCKLNFALVLFPVCRNTITWLRSTFFGTIVPFDDNLKFHKVYINSCLAHHLNLELQKYEKSFVSKPFFHNNNI